MTESFQMNKAKCQLHIRGINIKYVQKIKYLGSVLSEDEKSDKIRRDIGLAKESFQQVYK